VTDATSLENQQVSLFPRTPPKEHAETATGLMSFANERKTLLSCAAEAHE